MWADARGGQRDFNAEQQQPEQPEQSSETAE